MSHTIFINSDNFIEVHIIGDLNSAKIVKIGLQVVDKITHLEENGYKINLLIDYSKAAETEEFAKTIAKSIAQNIKLNKAAGFGADETSRKTFEETSKKAGISHKVRLFETREEAEVWLKE